MPKLIIFDWDGTLADSVGKIIRCKQFLAGKYNLPLPSDETIKSVLGTKFESALATCFPTASKEALSELGKEFHILMQQPAYQATLFPKTKEMLDTLKKDGLRLAIATSKSRKEFDTAIVHNKLSGIFEIICCGDEHPGKPNPAMLNYIMRECVVEPDDCVMIGDTTADILLANNAGVKAIGVTFGAHSIEKLQTVNPAALISNWAQLPETMDNICSQNQIYCRL